MKKGIMLLMAFAMFVVNAHSAYYYYRGKRLSLTVQSNKKYVVVKPISAQYAVVDDVTINSARMESISRTFLPTRYTSLKCGVVNANQSANFSGYEVVYSANAYKSNGTEVYISDLFSVKLKKANDLYLLENMAKRYGVTLNYDNKYLPPLWYELSCIGSGRNALDMANIFYESGLFAAAEPDIQGSMAFDGSTSCSSNDPYFGVSWNLQNTGQMLSSGNGTRYRGVANCDINYCGVSSLVPKNSNVIVAVIDQGIKIDHPDLKNNIVNSWDSHSQTSPNKLLGTHGTCCAGVIGAVANNGIGVTGIASNCKLMGISWGDDKRAFRYAADNGASVISCSWHYNSYSQEVEEGIDYALTKGRNGKGCVIVFAAGNKNQGVVNYPGSYHPDIIVVGAISPCAQRLNPNSCDGENWGSSYGTALDVMAPGVSIPTTTYDTAYNSTYRTTFNGTSAACPHVSAVAALMLSVNPNLTQKEVANIIESTAQKVGGYNYTLTAARLNGTWNIEMGYGLLNAYAAVQEAKWQQWSATERRMMEYLYATGPLSRQILSRYVTLPALPASTYITTATVSFMPRRRTFQTATSLSEKDTVGQIVPVIGKPRKIMENGQVYILKDGVKYDLSGRIVESR